MRTWNTVIFVVWGLAALTGCSGGIVPPQPSQGETTKDKPSQGETTKDKPSQGEITKSKPSQGMTLTGQIQITLNLDPPDGQTSKPGPLPRQIDDQTTPYGPADDQRADIYLYVPYSEHITYPSPDEIKNWSEKEVGPGGVLLYPSWSEHGARLRKLYFPDTPGGEGSPPIPVDSFRYVKMPGSTEDSPQYGTVTVYEKLPVSPWEYAYPGESKQYKTFYYEASGRVSKDDDTAYPIKTYGASATPFTVGFRREKRSSEASNSTRMRGSGLEYLWPEEKSETYYAELFVRSSDFPHSLTGYLERRPQPKTGPYDQFYSGTGLPYPESWKKIDSDTQ